LLKFKTIYSLHKEHIDLIEHTKSYFKAFGQNMITFK